MSFEREMVFCSFSRSLQSGHVALIKYIIAALLSFILLSSQSSDATEAWADPKLPVHDGLELWLDATRAAGDQPAPVDGKLNKWRDASGKNRNLKPPDASAQPSLLKIGAVAIVRFDGIDDQLRAVKLDAKLDSFTIVLVAAPRRNMGAFAAFMALNAANERDYSSGLNVDLGPTATAQFSVLNVEGRGFGGAKNLRTRESTFAGLHTLVISSDAKDKTVRLMVDGQAEGHRPRDVASVSMDEITLGARYYNNGAGPQHADGFGRSDIAELLIYNRALAPAELKSLRKYIDARYSFIKDVLPADEEASAQLERVTNGTVFVKHFELPLDDTNPNVLRRLETRLLVRDTNGAVYGITYKWRTNYTDADIITNAVTEDIAINTGSGTRTQQWFYPGPLDCLRCHTPAASYVLGVKTRQLNGTYSYPGTGTTDNQLRAWNHVGLFDTTLNENCIPITTSSSPVTNPLSVTRSARAVVSRRELQSVRVIGPAALGILGRAL